MAVHKHDSKSGETIYKASYLGPDGRRRVETVRTLKPGAGEKAHADAEAIATAKAHAQRLAVKNGEWKDPRAPLKKTLLHDLIDKFLQNYRSKSGKIDYYETKAKAWKKYLPNVPAEAITPADVEAMRRTREGTLRRFRGEARRKKADKGKPRQERVKRFSASTVRKDMVSLGTLFRWAQARGYVSSNPAEPYRVARPSEPANRTEYLTPKEEMDLLEACPEWLRPAVLMAVYSGMDVGEILGDRGEKLAPLSSREVDLRGGILHATRGKTNVARKIPLALPRLKELLTEALKVRKIRPEKPEPVFLGPDGKAIDREAAESALKRAYKAAGIVKGQPWKILRHTFGSRCAEAGLNLPDIQYLMGHRSPMTTARYMHLSPEHLKKAAEKLANYTPACTSTPNASTEAKQQGA